VVIVSTYEAIDPGLTQGVAIFSRDGLADAKRSESLGGYSRVRGVVVV